MADNKPDLILQQAARRQQTQEAERRLESVYAAGTVAGVRAEGLGSALPRCKRCGRVVGAEMETVLPVPASGYCWRCDDMWAGGW